MRKIYILLSLLFIGSLLTAQVNLPTINPQPLNHPLDFKLKKSVNNKILNCTDTVEYPISKLTGLLEVDTMDIASYISGTAQVYYFSGSGTLSGISAHVYLDLDGVPGNSSPIIMTIKVYNVNVDNEPSTLIDSADVQVVDVGFQAQSLLFSSPVAISDTFAVALELNAAFPANPYYVTNTSFNSDGNGEKLSSAKYLGVWYNAFDDFGGWDMDCILSPIFTTDITSLYTATPTSVCPNDTVTFTNTSTVNTDAMFNTFNTTTKPLHQWDFKDGTGTYNVFDTVYSWSTPGSYNVDLITTYYGYSLNCIDITSKNIIVHDTATSNFGYSYLGGGSFQFSDSSFSANSFTWDFGDGSPLDNSQNPSHTYASQGNYQVCLTVTDTNGCNVDIFCDSVSFSVGLPELTKTKEINVYPIPAKKYFYVNVPNNYLGADIILTDVVGKKKKVITIENQEKIKVLTEGISSGIYFVSIDYRGERVYTQRIVIDK